ncbi:MAG TPA: sigma-70 family RNA polymerase sigma factor [Stenomitos sp.]
MNQLEERLDSLVTEACKHPPGSAARQRNLTRIIRLIGPKLWRENTPYYQDALQQTWVYFCQNICEGKTGRAYDPERGTIVTWLNFYLKKRLHDFYTKQIVDGNNIVPPKLDDSGENPNPLENIASEPDVPPLLEQVQQWVEEDVDGELRRIHIANRQDVTAQVLILRRLPPETSWKDLATEFNLSVSTLSSFYQRQCLPRLRKFGESEGYL